MDNAVDDLTKLLLTDLPSDKSQEELNYTDLGFIWEEIVQDHINNHSELVFEKLNLINSDIENITFSHSYTYPKGKLLKNENRIRGVFDIFIKTKDSLPNYILEIKLNPKNVGTKEIKYLYYTENTVLVFILFFPAHIKYPNKLYRGFKDRCENAFNDKYEPELYYHIDRDRIKYLGAGDLGLCDISTKKLKLYLDKRIENITKTFLLLYAIYPKYLLIEDLCNILNIHHETIRRFLRLLDNNGVILKKTGDIYDSKSRVMEGIKMYRIKPNFVNHPESGILVEKLKSKYNINFPNSQGVGRIFQKSILRSNDRTILCYLNHFPNKWISVPDLLRNTELKAQGEMRRRLDYLVSKQWVLQRFGSQLDLNTTNNNNRAKWARFYKLNKIPIQMRQNSCSCSSEPPRLIYGPLNITTNELIILLFLGQKCVNKENPVSMKDISDSLQFNFGTVLHAVRRLEKREDLPLEMKQGWVLSQGKSIKLRSSPVIYLSGPLDSELKGYTSIIPIPTLIRSTTILPLGLTPYEAEAINAIHYGAITMDDLVQVIRINKRPKSNRSMLNAIVKRLSDSISMSKRGLTPIITNEPYKILPPYEKDTEFFLQISEIQHIFDQ